MNIAITHYWDGQPCLDMTRHASVELAFSETGALRITAQAQAHTYLPATPPLSRSWGLWEYDVVECFLLGEQEYLEIELSAEGHYLVLRFDAPRHCIDRYEEYQFAIQKLPAPEGFWRTQIEIPATLLPRGLKTLNGYAISGPAEDRHYLSATALPGEKPDFHQPQRFVLSSLTFEHSR